MFIHFSPRMCAPPPHGPNDVRIHRGKLRDRSRDELASFAAAQSETCRVSPEYALSNTPYRRPSPSVLLDVSPHTSTLHGRHSPGLAGSRFKCRVFRDSMVIWEIIAGRPRTCLGGSPVQCDSCALRRPRRACLFAPSRTSARRSGDRGCAGSLTAFQRVRAESGRSTAEERACMGRIRGMRRCCWQSTRKGLGDAHDGGGARFPRSVVEGGESCRRIRVVPCVRQRRRPDATAEATSAGRARICSFSAAATQASPTRSHLHDECEVSVTAACSPQACRLRLREIASQECRPL